MTSKRMRWVKHVAPMTDGYYIEKLSRKVRDYLGGAIVDASTLKLIVKK
jgi:hypothetical protein